MCNSWYSDKPTYVPLQMSAASSWFLPWPSSLLQMLQMDEKERAKSVGQKEVEKKAPFCLPRQTSGPSSVQSGSWGGLTSRGALCGLSPSPTWSTRWSPPRMWRPRPNRRPWQMCPKPHWLGFGKASVNKSEIWLNVINLHWSTVINLPWSITIASLAKSTFHDPKIDEKWSATELFGRQNITGKNYENSGFWTKFLKIVVEI